MLVACSSFAPQPTVIERPAPPAELTAKCPEVLPEPENGKASNILEMINEWSRRYHQCADRHNSLVEYLDQ